MDELRLILIITGISVLALIYFFSRRSQQNRDSTGEKTVQEDTEWMEEIARQRHKLAKTREQQPESEPLPTTPALHPATPPPLFDADPSKETKPPEQSTAPSQETTAGATPSREQQSASPSPPQELIVVLHIIAPRDTNFVGANLFSSLEEIGLRFGEGGIFHYSHSPQDKENTTLFSVANILEPGTFVGGQMEQEFTTPGVIMFMRAPGVVPARDMVETLLLKAQQLAQLLGGEIHDEAREPLSESTMKSLLDRATTFDSAVQHRA